MRTATALFLAFQGLVMFLGPLARANGGEVGRDAGMIFPLESDSVQLVSENLYISLPPLHGKGKAQCSYVLRNLAGSPRAFDMAFVTNDPWPLSAKDYGALYRGANFHVQHGKEYVPFHLEALDKPRWAHLLGEPPDSLPIWHVSMRAKDTIELSMSYDVEWSGPGVSVDADADSEYVSFTFAYHAAPASLWAGRIESAHIEFYFEDVLLPHILECVAETHACVSVDIQPPGYQWHSTFLSWDMKDWEPTTDLSIAIAWWNRHEPR